MPKKQNHLDEGWGRIYTKVEMALLLTFIKKVV